MTKNKPLFGAFVEPLPFVVVALFHFLFMFRIDNKNINI